MKKLQRKLSWLLLLAMLFSMLSVGTYAVEDGTPAAPAEVTEAEAAPTPTAEAKEEKPAETGPAASEAPAETSPAASTTPAQGLTPVDAEKTTTENEQELSVQAGSAKAPSNNYSTSGTFDHIEIELVASITYNVDGTPYIQSKNDMIVVGDVFTVTAEQGGKTLTAGKDFSYTAKSIKGNKSNNGDTVKIKGTYPTGTKEDPVIYTISITKNIQLTNYNNQTVPVTLSVSTNYWADNNACPGLNNAIKAWKDGKYVGNSSGIDIPISGSVAGLAITTGKVMIRKVVSGGTGDFEFTIKNVATGKYASFTNSKFNTWSDSPVTVSVPANGTLTLSDVPVGTYRITEIQRTGYIVVDADGNYSAKDYSVDYTVETKENSSIPVATFTNKKLTNETGISLKKVASGLNTYKNPTVTIKNSNGNTVWSGTLTANGDTIYLSTTLQPGTYTVEETGYSETDYNCASTLKVGGTQQNGMSFTVTTADAGKILALEISNVYTAKPVTKNVSVTKIWCDNNDQDGKRPDSITINLLKDGQSYQTATVNEQDGATWTYTFTNVPADGIYTVTEETVEEYVATYSDDGLTITNTHTPATTSVSGEKIWEDDDNRDGIRPEKITVQLYADGAVVTGKTAEVKAGTDGKWKYSFTGLPKYDDGEEITYTVEELNVTNGYTATAGNAGNNYTITNTHTPAVYSNGITVTKVWEDNNNRDGKRTDSVVVALMNGDTEVGTLTLNEENNWTGSFDNIPVKSNGQEISYSLVEKTDLTNLGYTSQVTGDAATGFTVTNKRTPETTSVSGEKTWNDDNDRDGVRPEKVVVELYKTVNGQTTKVTEKTLSDENGWGYKFDNLYVNEDGKPITYFVKEVMDEKTAELYDSAVAEGTYDLVNTHNPEKVTVTVEKRWDDKNNQDGVRPDSIQFNLFANGVQVNEKPYTITRNDDWKLEISGLYKFSDGEQIEYTVEEVNVDENYEADEDGLVITNTHVPEKTEVTVTKKWDDAKNQDGIRPATVTVALMKTTADGLVEVTRATFDGDGDAWEYTFRNLDKFENGKLVSYSVQELEVAEDYEANVDGFTITNTHNPATTSVTVNKVWADNNDQDGLRPDEITVYLTVKGEKDPSYIAKVTPDKDGKWSYTFLGLPKYRNGQEIIYVVSEKQVENYSTEIKDNGTSEVTITNKHTTAVTELSIEKVWKDNNDKKDKRPDSIKVTVFANGKSVTTVELNEKNQWKAKVENLPVNADGKAIEYTVKEDGVKYYVGKVTGSVKDGFTVTNTFVDIPLTGDTMNLLFWSIMIIGAGAVLAGVTIHTRRKRA